VGTFEIGETFHQAEKTKFGLTLGEISFEEGGAGWSLVTGYGAGQILLCFLVHSGIEEKTAQLAAVIEDLGGFTGEVGMADEFEVVGNRIGFAILLFQGLQHLAV
jgi:hypothetical protein